MNKAKRNVCSFKLKIYAGFPSQFAFIMVSLPFQFQRRNFFASSLFALIKSSEKPSPETLKSSEALINFQKCFRFSVPRNFLPQRQSNSFAIHFSSSILPFPSTKFEFIERMSDCEPFLCRKPLQWSTFLILQLFTSPICVVVDVVSIQIRAG